MTLHHHLGFPQPGAPPTSWSRYPPYRRSTRVAHHTQSCILLSNPHPLPPLPTSYFLIPMYIYICDMNTFLFHSTIIIFIYIHHIFTFTSSSTTTSTTTTVLDWDGVDSTEVPGAAQVLPVLPRAEDAPLHRVEVLRHSHTVKARRRHLRRLNSLQIRIFHRIA